MLKYLRNDSETVRFCTVFYTMQAGEAVEEFWNSSHPHWDNFKLVPYTTVKRLIENLDDDLYNKLPEQPPPSKQPTPSKQPKPSSSSASKTSTGAKPPAPTPPDDPLEEPNVWCEILKLEGRVSNNKIADGFIWWLEKNQDTVIYEVNRHLLIIYLCVQNQKRCIDMYFNLITTPTPF